MAKQIILVNFYFILCPTDFILHPTDLILVSTALILQYLMLMLDYFENLILSLPKNRFSFDLSLLSKHKRLL